MTSVLIAICGFQMCAQAIEGLIAALTGLTAAGINFEVKFFSHYGLERERNRAVSYFLESSHDYLFFLDTDIVPRSDTILKLLADNKAIVSGFYYYRTNLPCACEKISDRYSIIPTFKLEELRRRYHSQVLEVDAVGCGCLLIRREVFLQIKPPWFKFFIDYTNKQDFYNDFGEDIFFSKKAKESGFQIFLDLQAQVGHLHLVPLGDTRRVGSL